MLRQATTICTRASVRWGEGEEKAEERVEEEAEEKLAEKKPEEKLEERGGREGGRRPRCLTQSYNTQTVCTARAPEGHHSL